MVPQVPVETNDRLSFRIPSNKKALLIRAATIQHTNLTEFVTRTALSMAKEVIEQNKYVTLTKRNNLKILSLLEHPPAPNDKLLAAALALPKRSCA